MYDMNCVIRICICMICVWLCVCADSSLTFIDYVHLCMIRYVWKLEGKRHVNPCQPISHCALKTARLRMFTFVCRVWLHKANRKLLLAHLPPLASFHSFQWEKKLETWHCLLVLSSFQHIGDTTEYHPPWLGYPHDIHDYIWLLSTIGDTPTYSKSIDLGLWGIERSVDWTHRVGVQRVWWERSASSLNKELL